MILFTTGYKNFTPTGFGGIASRDSIFVIIFVCFAQKCRQKFVLTVALQRCYNNFTPTGLGDVALPDSVLSSFLLVAKKNICDFIYNGIQKFHPDGVKCHWIRRLPISKGETPFGILNHSIFYIIQCKEKPLDSSINIIAHISFCTQIKGDIVISPMLT